MSSHEPIFPLGPHECVFYIGGYPSSEALYAVLEKLPLPEGHEVFTGWTDVTSLGWEVTIYHAPAVIAQQKRSD